MHAERFSLILSGLYYINFSFRIATLVLVIEGKGNAALCKGMYPLSDGSMLKKTTGITCDGF